MSKDLNDGFRLGLETAALYFESKAQGIGERLAHMEANAEMIPQDIRYRLIENLRDDRDQASMDARDIRLLPPPSDAPEAVLRGWGMQRQQFMEWVEMLQGQRNRSQNRERVLHAEKEKWNAVRERIIAMIRKQDQYDSDDPARGEMLTEVRQILEAP